MGVRKPICVWKECCTGMVNNGISRRAWARNENAMFAIKREMEKTPGLKVTIPNRADEELIDIIFRDEA
jgi:hypothetical protein